MARVVKVHLHKASSQQGQAAVKTQGLDMYCTCSCWGMIYVAKWLCKNAVCLSMRLQPFARKSLEAVAAVARSCAPGVVLLLLLLLLLMLLLPAYCDVVALCGCQVVF
jgi:hypothetical protein